jgi:hypothetical protein
VRLYLRSADRRPDPPPLRTNDRAAVLTGTVVWAVLLIPALLLRSRLESQGRGWWVWTPVAGVLLGCYGLYYLRRRGAGRSRAEPARRPGPTPGSGSRGSWHGESDSRA